MTIMVQLSGLLFWLALCFIAAGIGAAASISAGTFYTSLIRPGWSPPPYLFGPVWTVLYTMMAIAIWLVWRVDGFATSQTACILFLLQLGVNALWSWIFFVWHRGAWAFVEILLLWGLLIATILAFWPISMLAALLMIPYLLWVSFAAGLSFTLWRLNPQIL